MKFIWPVVFVLAALAVIVFAKDYEAAPPRVKTIVVERGALSNSIRTTGVVSTTYRVKIAPTVSSRVTAVNVDTGNRVEQGQQLVVLDSSHITQQVAVEETEVDLLGIEVANQTRVLKVLNKDFQAGGESLEAVRVAEERLDTLRARLRQARAKVKLSRLRKGEYTLSAPFTGTVVESNVRAGETAIEGAAVLTLAKDGAMEILAKVDPVDAMDIMPGMPVRISLEGVPDVAMKEQVLRIEPAIQKNGSADYLAVWVSLTSSEHQFRLDQQVDVWLTLVERNDVLRLPLEALTTKNSDEFFAWVVEDERLRLAVLETGAFSDQFVEITSGVSAGQVVAVLGNSQLKEGEKVSVDALAEKP